MEEGRSHSKRWETTPTDEPRYLFVSANGHTYLFSYRSGEERELYFVLIDCARRPETELGWPEVFFVIEHLAPFVSDPPSER